MHSLYIKYPSIACKMKGICHVALLSSPVCELRYRFLLLLEGFFDHVITETGLSDMEEGYVHSGTVRYWISRYLSQDLVPISKVDLQSYHVIYTD